MLSYERLLERLHALSEIADQLFSGEEYKQRRRRIQAAIKSAIISSQAGIDGSQEVLSPGQLKHWLEKKIKEIHQSFDDDDDDDDDNNNNDAAVQEEEEETEEEQAPSPGKRKLLASTTPVAAASSKRRKRQTTEEQNAAAAFLVLARPATPAFIQDLVAARRINRGRNAYTQFPAIDRSGGLKDAFLAGMQYALQNLAAAAAESSAPAFNHGEFHEYVTAELGIKTALEVEVGETQAEEGGAAGDVEATWAAGQLTGMANARDVGVEEDAGQADGKGFWDVV